MGTVVDGEERADGLTAGTRDFELASGGSDSMDKRL